MDKDEQLATLATDICETVNNYVKDLEWKVGRPTLVQDRPELAQEVLLLKATGMSRRKVAKATGVNNGTIARIESDFADYMGDWKRIGGEVSGSLFMDATSSASELLQELSDAVSIKDTKLIESLSKALGSLNKTVEVSHRQAMTARGEASQITREEKVATVEDVNEWEKQAMAQIKEAEVIDAD